MSDLAHPPFASILGQAPPRYSSYPTASAFDERVGSAAADAWLMALPRQARVALYVHIPYCESLCWFCACRTQRLASAAALDAYLAALEVEIARIGAALRPGVRIVRMDWGGGSPTVLPPRAIRRLTRHLAAHLPLDPAVEVSVEVDARLADPERYAALAAAGMTRGVIAVQDFAPVVERAIGRHQSRAQTHAAAMRLRGIGVERLAVDLVYGLPAQTIASLEETARAVAELAPEAIALTAYAHVPWMAKRQKMIDPAALPDPAARLRLFRRAAAVLAGAGFRRVGIDHFVRPGSSLDEAEREGRLRRCFQGYVADAPDAVIGLGASAISRFPQGFVQNHCQTRLYTAALEEGRAAAERGAALGLEDRVRGRAIEMLMCGLRIDTDALRAAYGDFAGLVEQGCDEAAIRFPHHVLRDAGGLAVVRDAPLAVGLVARVFDMRTPRFRPNAPPGLDTSRHGGQQV
jgi:oxygen-independent coproporphyrinogen-3 oxidase